MMANKQILCNIEESKLPYRITKSSLRPMDHSQEKMSQVSESSEEKK